QKSILLIDIWSVHQSKEFTGWMKGHHLDIKISYIPGGCTGKFQPADIGLQQPIKHHIRCQCLEDLVAYIEDELDNGVGPGNIHMPTDINRLRNATAVWITKTFKWLQDKPNLIKSVC
ncbi:hypothetical protein BS47DRAFT_1299355, partial [Hydnum rufescens UP504]